MKITLRVDKEEETLEPKETINPVISAEPELI